MFETNGLLEILWTVDNLRAYKKLYPVQKKYPNIPIMTMDDDIILSEDCIETYMNEHIKHPNDILTEIGSNLGPKGECRGFSFRLFRLFPPNSLLDIDSKYFKEIYDSSDDDAYISVLAWLKHTNVRSLRSKKAKEIVDDNYKSTALRNEYKFKVKPNVLKDKLLNTLKKDKII